MDAAATATKLRVAGVELLRARVTNIGQPINQPNSLSDGLNTILIN